MATINIQRTSEFANRLRDYKVLIDGREAGVISNGQNRAFTTSAGHHIVTVKIDWCSSPEHPVEIKDGEIKYLKVGGFKAGRWIMPASGAVVALHIILKMAFAIDYIIFFVVPAFILLVYYISLGRKKYLFLTETNKEQPKPYSDIKL